MRKILFLLIIAGLAYWGWQQSHRITQTVDDGALTAHVLAQIARSKPLALLSVRVSTKQGAVQLTGHVRDRKDEEDLLLMAENVKGVNRVDNRLALDERLRTEDEMKKDLELTAIIKKDLVEEEGLRGMQIHVSVDQGNVLLEGEVPSSEQARLCEQIAKSVQGVKNVRNEVRVKPAKGIFG